MISVKKTNVRSCVNSGWSMTPEAWLDMVMYPFIRSISNFKSVYAPSECTYLDQAGGRREIVLPGTFFDRGLSANETRTKPSNRRKKDLYQFNGLATSE
ncbi:hypothetical protein TNCT_384601 [Trichonephila clavata]|uniref:Uncharacterized protein n=1 Tax=Trichonephila clavata TaxID=2740835 RepID=A0A8X6ID72_TRICU|nr:hypothetical protein TNCT_384601 [Trichonephila clavata]